MTMRGSENQFVQAYLTAFRLDPFDFMYRVQGEVVAAEGPSPAEKIEALDKIFKTWRDVKGDPGQLFLSLGTLKREDIPTATKADLSAEQKVLIKAGVAILSAKVESIQAAEAEATALKDALEAF